MFDIYILISILFIITIIIVVLVIRFIMKPEKLLSKVSNRITDGYVIFNTRGKITNYNETFLYLFDLKDREIKNKNINEVLKLSELNEDDIDSLKEACEKTKESNEKFVIEVKMTAENKIYRIDIMSLSDNDILMRYVMVVKDITKSYDLIQELRSDQDMMANRERFATLGQLISGIVHSLKSPIFAITGQLEGLIDLINEYKTSVDDGNVTKEDHHEIAKEMKKWLDKMKEQMEYISDAITAVRSQVVTLNDEEGNGSFTIGEFVKYIDVLMKNNLKQALIILNFTLRVNKDLEVTGNLNALVQVINNLIMNAIASYEGRTNEVIDVVIEKNNDILEISVIDTGKGIPKKIQDKIFKEIVLNDSGKGSGLGLFISYSNIKAIFGRRYKIYYYRRKGVNFYRLCTIKLERKGMKLWRYQI